MSVGDTVYCLMDYNCSHHILKPPHNLRILDQQLYEVQLKETEEVLTSCMLCGDVMWLMLLFVCICAFVWGVALAQLWRSAISESLVQLIEQQEQMRAKEQENPLAMLDVPTYTDNAPGRQVALRIPKKKSKKQRIDLPAATEALNPYQRRPTRPRTIMSMRPEDERPQSDGLSTTTSSLDAPIVRGPVCPACSSRQTRVLYIGTSLEVARNETWGNKDAPTARRKCECDSCGHEWVEED